MSFDFLDELLSPKHSQASTPDSFCVHLTSRPFSIGSTFLVWREGDGTCSTLTAAEQTP